MGQVVPVARRAVGGPRGLDGVQRLAYGAVAQRVEVHLEAEPVQGGDMGAQGDGVDEAQSGRLFPAVVRVGGEETGCPVLHDPVLHDLDGARRETARAAALTAIEQLVDLLGAATTVPPQCASHPCGEHARRRGLAVGAEDVEATEAGPDQSVLPRRDSQGMQHALRAEEGVDEFTVGGRRHEPADEVGGALLEHPGR